MSTLDKIIENYQFGTGLLGDTRTEAEKAKDYKHEEVSASAPPVVWKEKTEAEWRKFDIMNQNQTSSCVAHAVAKCMGIENFVENGKYLDLSRRFIYANRSNKPDLGMYFIEAMEYIRKTGVPLEYLVPSIDLTESQMNDNSDIKEYIIKIAEVFKTLGYVQFTFPPDIDEIASIIEQKGKGILLGFSFDYDEWDGFPEATNPSPKLRHAVTAVDFTLYQGVKHLIIEDSWGIHTAINGRRLISEDFLKKRCIFAGYFLNLAIGCHPDQPIPHHTFTTVMEYGQTNQEIVALQDVLKYEDVMPDDIPSSGFYGEITRKGVLAFQQRYQVDTPENLSALNGKRVGQKTLAVLNQLYG